MVNIKPCVAKIYLSTTDGKYTKSLYVGDIYHSNIYGKYKALYVSSIYLSDTYGIYQKKTLFFVRHLW